MSPPNRVLFGQRHINKFEALGESPLCYRCGEPFEIGKPVVACGVKRGNLRKAIYKIYHEACYDSMFI